MHGQTFPSITTAEKPDRGAARTWGTLQGCPPPATSSPNLPDAEADRAAARRPGRLFHDAAGHRICSHGHAAGAGRFGPGVYGVTLADSDLPLSAPSGMRAGMVGTWEMTVDGPGRALVRFNGQQVVDMPFQMHGNQVIFAEGSGQYACPAAGRYTWEATSAGVRFTTVEDSCNGRVVALTSRPWTKRP